MATSQQFLVFDSSTAANYKSWASAISDIMRTAGFTNSSDSGQLDGAGGNNWAGVTTAPGSGLFYYEIFEPGDGLTNYFLKIEYGNGASNTNSPTLRVSVGTSTDGAGTLTGSFTAAQCLTGQANTTGGSTTYECDFSYGASRLSMLLWRSAPSANNAVQVFALQRSLDGSGTATGSYVTLFMAGYGGTTGPGSAGGQQTLHFTAGPAQVFAVRQGVFGFVVGGWQAVSPVLGAGASTTAFNGGIPMSNVQPNVGLYDFPCTVVAVAYAPDITEGVPFTVTNQYGNSVTYMPSKNGGLLYVAPGTNSAACVEYD